MTKKLFALIYLVVSSVLNVLFTGVVIGVICGIVLLFMRFVFRVQGNEPYATAIFGSFTVGLVLSFFLFSKITTKVVKKYRFDERFGGEEKKSGKKEEESEKKTVLPSSVLEDEEDSKWKE